MESAEFYEWMERHVRATAASNHTEKLSEILVENEEVIFQQWKATAIELGICTDRLVGGGRIPRFPDGHMNAIKAELDNLRRENARRKPLLDMLNNPPDRREECNFMGICCGGVKWPDCQEVQKRWEALMLKEGIREKKAKKKKKGRA